MSWDWEKLKEQQHKKGDIPPNVDDFIRKVNQIKLPGGPILIILIITLLFLIYSVVDTINQDEVAIVQSFGKYVGIDHPGLTFKIPVIRQITKVKVERVYREEFGFRSLRTPEKTRFALDTDTSSVALMLTGDLNVGLVPWIIHYKINNPYNYLFKVGNVHRLLTDMSEATMRIVVGDRSINEVITKREFIADEAKEILQRELDRAEAGISIITIEMKETNVPDRVQPSFNEVNQAVQEKEKLIYQAKEEYNKAIPAARGEAEKTIKAAEGYALDRINRAKGNAARFKSVYAEYVKAKDVTKRRLYLEMLKDIFPKLEKTYIIDSDQKNLLPLLNLGEEGLKKSITQLP